LTLIAHWKCDENQGRNVTSAADSSGHPNNHDFASVGYATASVGFGNWNRHSAGSGDRHSSVGNNADFLLTGDLTIMAWLWPQANPTNDKYLVACGLGTSEVQADNLLWSLIWNSSGQFGMRWEQGAGVDVNALSPASQIAVKTEVPLHLAVVRSINGAQRDVKFFLNGVDLAADVTGLTAPDGGANALCEMLRLPNANSNIPVANIWNVRVYDTAELAAAVWSVYTSELPAPYRFGYTPNPAEPLIQYDPLGFGAYDSEEVAIDKAQAGAGAYAGVPTGTELDQVERPNSGWAQVGP
jgi:hypothetical protein